MNRLRRLWKGRQYILEALYQLSLAKFRILCRPFQCYAQTYGFAHAETLREEMATRQLEVKAIQQAIKRVAPYLPWKSQCLDQAMAAQCMLKRRGLQYTLYFGVLRKQETFIAHAWIRSGNTWVLGYQPDQPYTIVATYAYWRGFKEPHLTNEASLCSSAS